MKSNRTKFQCPWLDFTTYLIGNLNIFLHNGRWFWRINLDDSTHQVYGASWKVFITKWKIIKKKKKKTESRNRISWFHIFGRTAKSSCSESKQVHTYMLWQKRAINLPIPKIGWKFQELALSLESIRIILFLFSEYTPFPTQDTNYNYIFIRIGTLNRISFLFHYFTFSTILSVANDNI